MIEDRILAPFISQEPEEKAAPEEAEETEETEEGVE